jgi:hypothetical protein
MNCLPAVLSARAIQRQETSSSPLARTGIPTVPCQFVLDQDKFKVQACKFIITVTIIYGQPGQFSRHSVQATSRTTEVSGFDSWHR